MKISFLIGFMFLSVNLFAQDNLLFDTLTINANTKLIGRYPQFDNQKTYRNLNFIIEDSATIKKVIAALPLGNEGENSIESPGFTINLVKDFSEVKSWIVNPGLNSVMYNGRTYAFKTSKLKEIAKKFPFDYSFDKIVFESKMAYEVYLEKQKTKTDFLFSYAPTFEYEGSFDMQFPNNRQFSSPKAIIEYLNPLIEKIVPRDDYKVIYVLKGKNLNDQNQFTMTIMGSKKLYENFDLDKLIKEAWEPTIEEGWFFYKK